MKNKIEDLRNHLFAQLERLGDDEKMKNPLALEKELKRAQAISQVSAVLVESAKAETNHLKVLGAAKSQTDFIPIDTARQIGTGKDNKDA